MTEELIKVSALPAADNPQLTDLFLFIQGLTSRKLTGTQLKALLGIAKNKLDATVAPLGTNDNTEGFGVLSFWADIQNNKVYVCLDPLTDSAIWFDITQTGGGGGGFETVISETDISGAVTEVEIKLSDYSGDYEELQIRFVDCRSSAYAQQLKFFGSVDDGVTYSAQVTCWEQGGQGVTVKETYLTGNTGVVLLYRIGNHLMDSFNYNMKLLNLKATGQLLVSGEGYNSDFGVPNSGFRHMGGSFYQAATKVTDVKFTFPALLKGTLQLIGVNRA